MNRVDSIKDSPPLGGTISKAHLVLSWEYNLKIQSEFIPNYKKVKYLYNKADHANISEFFNGIDWVREFKDKNVQESYGILLNYYNKACELYVPKIDIFGEIRLKEKWFTHGIKSNMRKRLNLWRANQSSKWSNQSLKRVYEAIKRKCDKEIKKGVRDYEKIS